MLLRICNRYIPNCICKCFLSSPPNIDLNISAICYLNNRLFGVNHNNNNIKSQMEIHLRRDNKRSRRWSSQWQSRDSRYADFEYSTIAADVHPHTLSLRSAAQLLFDLVSNNPSLIQIYDSFILRSISSHAISSSHSRVYSVKDAKPTKNKTKQNKKK